MASALAEVDGVGASERMGAGELASVLFDDCGEFYGARGSPSTSSQACSAAS